MDETDRPREGAFEIMRQFGETTPRLNWSELRRFTPARIGLARSGVSIATKAQLDFRRSHAAARDAVTHALNTERLAAQFGELDCHVIAVASQALTRRDYLMRPDLGRELTKSSMDRLTAHHGIFDLAIVIADGLSPIAAERHARPLLAALLPRLTQDWRLAPLVIAEQSRVALGDQICRALGAAGVLVLIGERPGLSAPDSLGAYLTWQPTPQTTDADRNCISNIRPEGMAFEEAVRRLFYLLSNARARNCSGVGLKDLSDSPEAISAGSGSLMT